MDKEMREPKCKHLVLDECSQEHHNNCLGMQQCILDLEQQLHQAQQDLKVAVEAIKENNRILNEIKCSPINETVYKKVKSGLEINTQALAKLRKGE